MFLRRQKKQPAAPLVSVIVLSHNKAEVTRRCFHGLLESSYRPLEVLGIDNGSTDDTADLYRSFASDAAEAGVIFRPTRCEENVGAATGRNLGLHEAQGHYIVFLDNDVVPRTRAWVEGLRAVLDKDGSIGIVGPKLLYPTPPHDIQFAGAAVTPTGWVKYLGRGEPCGTEEFNAPRECQCLISACWMMPTELYHHIGGLDEGFNPVQFEDIDYCYRARHAGYRVRYEPSVEMYHFENITSDGTSTINYPYVTVKNGMRFKRKWRFMFETEGGPSDDDLEWKSIERQPIEAIGPLEMVD